MRLICQNPIVFSKQYLSDLKTLTSVCWFVTKAQTTHPFKFCRVYKIFKKEGWAELEKPWITTGILRSMHNKDKLHKNILIRKGF